MPLTCANLLSVDEVLAGFDRVAPLYPHVPSLCMWRAWEVAAYARFKLAEPVLDVGCGDGAFFRLIWPDVRDATGVDFDSSAVAAAKTSGVYRRVIQSPAQELAVERGEFASAFANCSLEHMDDISRVLSAVHQSLRRGGQFLFSVVTDKFVEWNLLPALAGKLGGSPSRIQRDYLAYHHLANPLPVAQWTKLLTDAGFERIEYIPILNEVMGRMFLFVDTLWHVPTVAGELGGDMQAFISRYPAFARALRQWVAAAMSLEEDKTTGCGAVFRAWRSQ